MAALLLGIGQSFAVLEKQQVIICSILVLGTIAGTLMVRPDFAAALSTPFDLAICRKRSPRGAGRRSRPLVAHARHHVRLRGRTVMTYIAYANFVGVHHWGLCSHPEIEEIRRRAAAGSPRDYLPDDPTQAARLRKLLIPLRCDAGMGARCSGSLARSFMIAGAAVLLPKLENGELGDIFNGWSLLTDQGHIGAAFTQAWSGCITAA